MIHLFRKNNTRRKILIAIILSLFIVCSYIPMFYTYELYVQWWELIIALLGGLVLWLGYFICCPKNSLFNLLWIAVVAIYFYLHILYFEGKILRASTILSVLGFIVVLLPFIVSNFKKKKTTSIEKPEVYLGRTRAYNRIHFRIRRMSLAPEGKAIALYGRWGCGKSHCIQFLSHRLQKEFERKEFDDNVTRDPASPLNKAFNGSFEICNISLWNYKTVDEAWTAIINELYYAITGDRVIDFRGILSRLANTLPHGEFLRALTEYIQLPKGYRDKYLIKTISRKIRKKRVLLIFDDIERAPYELIRSLLSLIERLKAIKRIVVMCAIADDELVKVYQEHGVNADSVHGYLSKIFDFPFYLPQPSYPTIRELEAKLIEKKYKDFPLLRSFLRIFNLNYDTPRQMERIAERLSSIELQYLYDAELVVENDYIAKNEKKEFCIFLVEIIRLLYKPVLEEINNNGESLLTLSKQSSCMVSNIDTDQKEKFKESYPVTANYISRDSLISSLLQHLSHYKSTDIKSAIIMEYARRSTLSPRECDDIVRLKSSYEGKKFEEIVLPYFKNDPDCIDSIEMAKHELIDYCIENAYNVTYADFLNYIYACDPPDYKFSVYDSSNFHNNYKERFIHLLNTCGDFMDKVESKNFICSAIKSILYHSPLSDIYPYLCKLMRPIEIEYPWYGETYCLDNRTLDLIHTSKIINEIIISYSESMISFIFTDNYTKSVSHHPNSHELFHIYEKRIFKDFKSIIRNKIRTYLLDVSYEENNLYRVLVYLLCEAKYDRHRDILAVCTSKWKVDTFKPWINKCLQNVNPGSDIIDKIPGWIEKINKSRKLWSIPPKSEKYVDGANELLSIMEILQRKANSTE